jgi:hypothetical protein
MSGPDVCAMVLLPGLIDSSRMPPQLAFAIETEYGGQPSGRLRGQEMHHHGAAQTLISRHTV